MKSARLASAARRVTILGLRGLAVSRRRDLPVRVFLCAAFAVGLGFVVSWPAAFVWLTVVYAAQLLDAFNYHRINHLPDDYEPRRFEIVSSAATIFITSITYSAGGAILWFTGGPWERFTAVLWIMASIQNAVTHLYHVRAVFLSSIIANAAYLIALPVSSLFLDNTAIDASVLLAILCALVFVWHIGFSFRRGNATSHILQEAHRGAIAARDEAKKASQAKSSFLAAMSHEIRTPMNAVLGSALLLERTDLSSEQKEHVETLIHGGEVLMAILNDLLDLSKIEAGKLTIEPSDVDVRTVVEGVRRLWRGRAEEKGLDLIVVVDPATPPTIQIDLTRLRQILFNLVSNAVKFTDAGSVTLSVLAERRGPDRVKVRFSVADTGVGIAEDVIPTLFEAFEQADASVSRRYGGTGLGLAISQKLAHMMGGAIDLESAPGEGATAHFTVEVLYNDEIATPTTPIIEEDRTGQALVQARISPISQPTGETNNRREPKGLRILVAEDNQTNQRVLQAFLAPLECGAYYVNDGEAAITAATTQAFDLILMDVQMPQTDGYAATRSIRASGGAAAQVPIIAMTANALDGDREACLAAGMTDYLSKPLDPDALYDAITRACAPEANAHAPLQIG
ncbi:MAG: ATP-binding protein [Pseudomonadota bacterium]